MYPAELPFCTHSIQCMYNKLVNRSPSTVNRLARCTRFQIFFAWIQYWIWTALLTDCQVLKREERGMQSLIFQVVVYCILMVRQVVRQTLWLAKALLPSLEGQVLEHFRVHLPMITTGSGLELFCSRCMCDMAVSFFLTMPASSTTESGCNDKIENKRWLSLNTGHAREHLPLPFNGYYSAITTSKQ